MLNNQGRKVIKERIGNDTRSYDHYKQLRQEEAHDFDNRWNQVADQLNFKSSMGNALEYGGGASYQNRSKGGQGNKRAAEARGLAMPEPEYSDSRGLGYMNDQKHGHFIPQHARGQDMPVNYRNS